jgi:uncharacterized protein YggE
MAGFSVALNMRARASTLDNPRKSSTLAGFETRITEVPLSEAEQFLVSVTGHGTAQATFTAVQYSAAVNTTGKTGPKAKEAAKPIIAQIRDLIEKNAEEAGLDVQRIKPTFRITKAVRYDESKRQQVHDGYQANYTVAFVGKDVAAATKLHDQLTSIEGVEADTPVFLVDSSLDLEAEAFRLAVKDAKDRFESQCLALGMRTDTFRLVTWNAGDDHGHRGKVMALAASSGGGGKPVDLEPGKADKTVTVTLQYVRT